MISIHLDVDLSPSRIIRFPLSNKTVIAQMDHHNPKSISWKKFVKNVKTAGIILKMY